MPNDDVDYVIATLYDDVAFALNVGDNDNTANYLNISSKFESL